MKMYILISIFLLMISACKEKNVKDWNDKEVDKWFAASGWNKLPMKPDASINKRLFVEQNALNPEAWKIAYEFLKAGNFNEKEQGQHKLDENGTYANIEEYATKDSAYFEAHKKYIDIQYLAKGKEYIRVSPIELEKQVEVQAYDEKRDIEFFDKEEYTAHLLTNGNFLVLFPVNGHMPCMKVDSNEVVRKVVIKIPYVE